MGMNSAFAKESQPQVKVAQNQGAQRIVALSPHSVEMLFAIGVGDRIVATTEHADFPEQAKSITRIGGYYGVQIERIVELNPDLVVVWQGGNKLDDINRLIDLGFTVYDSSPKNLAQVADDLIALGELTANQTQAQTAADTYLSELQSIKSAHQQKVPVKVFYQLWSSPLMTVAKGSWIQNIIEVCQGENVFYDAATEYPQLSIENVLLTQAQVIVQSQDEGNILGIDWQAWPQLPAVANAHIYQLDADLIHRASPRSIEGVKAMCEAIDKAR